MVHIPHGTDSIRLSTYSIVPGSLALTVFTNGIAQPMDSDAYDLEPFSALLFCPACITADSAIAVFSVLPYDLSMPYYNKNRKLLDSLDLNNTPYTYAPSDKDPYLQISGLDYSGSFSRGISFGNNQDVVVQSNFNLQMHGTLQNDVEVDASITDNNIPIQPEGNTQQIQEFDKVYITLHKDAHTLTMGDFDITHPPGYFMQFYKKVQGAGYTGTYTLPSGNSLQSTLDLAVAKGLYAKQEIPILEGNQGPYKLKGNNGETFIIILAGTERVYMDGILLQRGAEQDYIMDYNSGEITFTPNRLLTKDKRIYIEFEYSDKSYFRSLAYSAHTFTGAEDKLTVQLNIYSEQDGKNQPLDQTITSDDRLILENAGDSVQTAFASGVDSIAFDASRILYKMIDTLGFDSVFVYSTDPDSAKYALRFTELGANKGNYLLSASLANGRVYTWVAPVDGIPQGSAEPVVLLAAPVRKQMVTLGGKYTIDKNNEIHTEVAFSNNDVNTFSTKGNGDNSGLAYTAGYAHDGDLGKLAHWSGTLDYEYTGKTFSALERYRDVEFERDWNILDTKTANEQLIRAGLHMDKSNTWNLTARSTAFVRQDIYTGFMQDVRGTYNTAKWQLYAGGSYLHSAEDSLSSQFIRPDAGISRTFPSWGGWKTGVRYEGEHNALHTSGDTLSALSYYYDQMEYFVSTADTSAKSIQASVIQRTDKAPDILSFATATNGITYQLRGSLPAGKAGGLQGQIAYRVLEIRDSTLTEQQPEKSILGRLQHNLVIKKGLLTSDIFYELGSGQEPKREYTFVEVEPGLGVYTWNDYNENGIAELGEFEVAVFADQANYIQVYVPTDEYIRTNANTFNYSIGINPKSVLYNAKGFGAFAAKFSSQSNMQLTRKAIDDGSFTGYIPFAAVDDSVLVNASTYVQHTIFYDRTASKFGMDYSFLQTGSRQVITIGAESREKQEQKFTIRYKLNTLISFNGQYSKGKKTGYSAAFENKNFTIPYYAVQPKLRLNKGAAFSINMDYTFLSSYNIEGTETLQSNAISSDIRYNVLTKSTLTARISYVRIDFVGDAESPVGYSMLEGLQDGDNILWSLNLDRKLSTILQMSASYEGRKTGDAPINHIGKLQIRALF
ncbi:MAG: hypothetical protein R2794_11680 [Chitinophagales bacterium]